MFTTINYLLYKKDKSELDPDLLEEFNPYLTNKVFSFYDSGKYSNFINDTLNQYSNVFKNKEDQFNFFNAVIPKLKWRKNEYIKSPTKKSNVEIAHIPEFLSKREIDYYLGNIDNTNINSK
jgi:hypothetical protein